MNTHNWTPITRDWIRIEDVTVDGDPVTPGDLTVAFLPPRTKPTAATVWFPVEAHPDDGEPAVLVAGVDADDTAPAIVVDREVELHGRVMAEGVTVTAPLARITF